MAKKFNRQTSDFMGKQRASGDTVAEESPFTPSDIMDNMHVASDISEDLRTDDINASKGARDMTDDKDVKESTEAEGAKGVSAVKDAKGVRDDENAKDAKVDKSSNRTDSGFTRHRRKRDRSGYTFNEGDPVKPADKPIDKPFKDEDEFARGFKAYGEPIARDEKGEEFNELKAMEELLSGSAEYGGLPLPEVFNAYPPEVQRKIMEWTDRDVKARRDDESRRKDELVRASIERERRRQTLPVIIIVVAVICGAILGFVTQNPWFSAAFLVIPIAVIVALFVSNNVSSNRGDRYRKPPK